MTRVALIACDHGLGHVRRMMLVAEELAEADADVTLLAPLDAVVRIRRSFAPDAAEPGEPSFRVHPFATLTTPEALRTGDPMATAWEQRLPDLSGFDRVVCDTLPEVVAVRPDALLVAQFLWHDVLEGVDGAYRTRASALSVAARVVAGSTTFAMPAVRELPGFEGVGLFVRPGTSRPASPGQDLLVSGGSTSVIERPLRALVERLAEVGPGRYATVHVDAHLLGSFTPAWMRPAVHDAAMYDALGAALVRPGLGAVTELVVRGIPVWTVREAGNTELAYNAAVLAAEEAGVDLGALTDAVPAGDAATSALVDVILAGPPRTMPPVFSTDGAAAVARLVLT